MILAATVIIGCGGGGGGGSNDGGGNGGTTDSFIVSGTVRDDNTNAAVVGAKVRIGSTEVSTNSQGQFRIVMTTSPIVRTYSIDGRNATPTPGYFDFWARANNKVQNAKCIELPIIPKGETSLGVIYLMNADSPPPFPPSCP